MEDDEEILNGGEGGEEDQLDEGAGLDDADLDDADGAAGGGDHDVDPADDPDEVAGRAPVERPRSRSQVRVETALREAREAKERAERLEQELRRVQTQPSAEDARRERERLEAMDPYERAQYERDQRMDRIERALQQSTFQSQDAADRASFLAKAQGSQALAAVADEVETRLAALRQNGSNVDRETLAKFLIGERALARSTKARTRAAKEGADRVRRNTVAPPAASRSDVRADGPRGDTREARRKRLEGFDL